MTDVVLDASALLAMMNREPGGALVSEATGSAVMSSVNAAEVASRLSDLGLTDTEIAEALRRSRVRIASFDEQAALDSARLRRATRFAGLSLGDRACLALARSRSAPVMTADRAWARLKLGVEIRVIR
ncbi:MAG: type II toxin-antitoxin system VapC family toxin [Alphaproteobacteria bacterium]|nr:type II toxin-antitoxin system VapC family toxin [Alphaproteobacteria bacterium]